MPGFSMKPWSEKTVEVLCEGASRHNEERLGGRTRTNKIVVFEGDAHRLTGQLVDVKVDLFQGFTLYGKPVMAG